MSTSTGRRGTASRSSSSSSRSSRSGVYLATTIPVAVFPEVDFPRVLVGVDNGVAPIDQMQVTVTRPIEEALNSVPGPRAGAVDHEPRLGRNRSVLLLERRHVPDARARERRARARAGELPPTAKLTANRLTFAAFPIMGYSLTSDTVPQTRLWEIATYDLKPRLNRMTGVSTIVVQGRPGAGVRSSARSREASADVDATCPRSSTRSAAAI